MFEPVGNPNCLLGEGPLWNESDKLLYWADIMKGQIFSYNPVSRLMKTELSCKYQTGAFLFAADNTLVVFTEEGVQTIKRRDGSYHAQDMQLLFAVEMIKGERFNDAIADEAGRMIAGTKTQANTDGKLYSFAIGREPAVLLDGLGITNGMGFSPDRKTFYHTDSSTKTITAYDYNCEQGTIANPRSFFIHHGDGVPDGMTVDESGDLWVACWGGASVFHLSAQGDIAETFKSPALQTSSVCIGGGNMNTLFVTSAATGCISLEDGKDESGAYRGGKVYMMPINSKGVPEFRVLL